MQRESVFSDSRIDKSQSKTNALRQVCRVSLEFMLCVSEQYMSCNVSYVQ